MHFNPDALREIMHEVVANYSINRQQVYLTGYSSEWEQEPALSSN